MNDQPGMWHPDYPGGTVILVDTTDILFMDQANFVIMEVAEATDGTYLGKIGTLLLRSVDDSDDDSKITLTIGLGGDALMGLLSAIGGLMQEMIDSKLIPPQPGYQHDS